ncbi:hypothetical protein SDC9_157907 [bioreactor metagenome]|uniref:Uncharacterized protein n=1 Tax=bioreactor metagenome TaxID=1076179 RepID=A0A645FAM5_9ZZZZ
MQQSTRSSNSALGARTGIFSDRRGRRGPVFGRSRADAVACPGVPRRDALHAIARPQTGTARRAGAGHGQRDHGTHGLSPAKRAAGGMAGDRICTIAPARRGHHLHVCAWPRLSQGAARAPAEAGRTDWRGGGAARAPRVHRFGAGARMRTFQPQRPGLARQAHAGAQSRGGLDVFSGRDLR